MHRRPLLLRRLEVRDLVAVLFDLDHEIVELAVVRVFGHGGDRESVIVQRCVPTGYPLERSAPLGEIGVTFLDKLLRFVERLLRNLVLHTYLLRFGINSWPSASMIIIPPLGR